MECIVQANAGSRAANQTLKENTISLRLPLSVITSRLTPYNNNSNAVLKDRTSLGTFSKFIKGWKWISNTILCLRLLSTLKCLHVLHWILTFLEAIFVHHVLLKLVLQLLYDWWHTECMLAKYNAHFTHSQWAEYQHLFSRSVIWRFPTYTCLSSIGYCRTSDSCIFFV